MVNKRTVYGQAIICRAKECDRNLPSKARYRGQKKCLGCKSAFFKPDGKIRAVAYTSMNLVRYCLK